MRKFLTALFLASVISFTAAAQEKNTQGRGERLLAEKIAYLTNAMQLTVEEAQAFWPLYNKVEADQKALWKAERDAFKALGVALKEKKDEKEIDSLLQVYVKAQQANVNLHSRNLNAYKKVLPVDKVAKFYRANENFRRQQINKLQGPRPQGVGDRAQQKNGTVAQNPSALK